MGSMEIEKKERERTQSKSISIKSIHISTYSAHTLTVLGYRVVRNNDSNGSYNGNGDSANTKSKNVFHCFKLMNQTKCSKENDNSIVTEWKVEASK